MAFRSGEEGGDRSILPARRRRPTGQRDTSRILVGGARTIGNWVPRDDVTSAARPAPLRAEEPSVDQPLRLVARDDRDIDGDDGDDIGEPINAVAGGRESGDEGDETNGDAPAKRRRGRRGGRGRRRTEDGSPVAADDLDGDESPRDDVDSDAVSDGDADEVADDDADYGAESEDESERTVVPAAIENDDADERPAQRRRSTRAVEPVAENARDERRDRNERDDRDDDQREQAPRRQRSAEVVDAASFPAAFVALGATERTLVPLSRFGFQTATPIQEQAIPALMNGLDVVGIAQTGSGKTVAFGVPMVEKLDPDLPEVQAIVLVPTRELAQQVLDVLADLARYTGLDAVGLLGGHSLQRDFKALEARPHIVVGTPGRILDHLGRGTLALRYVRYAVLDEADQMLDIGFLPDIRRILSRTPQRRQTCLFSATMPGTIRRLIWQFMQDPETISVAAESTTVDSVSQVYMEVASRDKVRAMRELIERELKGRTLIFCNMKRRVDNLEHDLARDGVRVGALHGDMDQKQRDRVVQQFREGALDVLIATNVAARGLDIPEITHVVNYDVPQNPEEYVHRIGRTGRAGRDGKAITFVSEWDMDSFDAIYAKHGDRMNKEDLDLYRPVPPRSSESVS